MSRPAVQTPSDPAAETMRLALDQSACIRSQSNIGETITHNICDGTMAAVPWGSADWLGFVALCGVGAFFAIMIVALSGIMIATIRDGF